MITKNVDKMLINLGTASMKSFLFKSPHSPHNCLKLVKHSNTSKLREVFISNDGVFSFCFYVWNFG